MKICIAALATLLTLVSCSSPDQKKSRVITKPKAAKQKQLPITFQVYTFDDRYIYFDLKDPMPPKLNLLTLDKVIEAANKGSVSTDFQVCDENVPRTAARYKSAGLKYDDVVLALSESEIHISSFRREKLKDIDLTEKDKLVLAKEFRLSGVNDEALVYCKAKSYEDFKEVSCSEMSAIIKGSKILVSQIANYGSYSNQILMMIKINNEDFMIIDHKKRKNEGGYKYTLMSLKTMKTINTYTTSEFKICDG